MSLIEQLLVGLGIDSDGYDRGIAGAMKSTDAFLNQVDTLVGPAIVGAFAAGAAGVAAFTVTSVKAAGDFEAGMLGFQSVTGSAITDAGFTLDDFQAKFLELGAVTAFSAAEAQEAAIELAKGGVAIPSIMEDATAATLDLASAGGLELGAAAGIVAKQLGVWAEKGVTATQVSNLLAQAANASTVDVDELAAGLANAQGTAKTAGVEYDQLVTTMAVLAPNFASASTAGTSLNNFLLRLQPTTDAATAAMIDIGLATEDGTSKFYDANGAFIGMDQASALLKTSLTGLSEAQKTQYLSTIFGNDAMGAAVSLAGAGAEGFNAVSAAMTAAGTAQEQAAIKQQGLNFAVDSLLGSFETLQIIVGLALIPILTDFVNVAIIPAVNAVSEFATMITTAEDPIFAITDAIYQFSPLLGDLVGYFLVAVTEGDKFNDFFANLPGPIQTAIRLIEQIGKLIADNWQPILLGVATVLGVIVVHAIAGMVAAVLTIAAPIVAAVAVAALMYAAYQNNFLGIQDIVTKVINAVKTVITTVMTAVNLFWKANGADIMAFTQAAFAQIMQIAQAAMNFISLVVMTVLNGITAFWNAHKDTIIATATNLWLFVKNIFQAGLNIIQGIIKIFTGIVSGDWQTFADGCAQVVQGLLDLLRGIFVNGLQAVKGVVELGLELVRSVLLHFVGDAESLGGNIINGIIDGIKGGISFLVDAVTQAAQSALDAAKSALGISSPSKVAYAQIGVPFMQGPINAIYDMIPQLESASISMAGAMLDSAQPGAMGDPSFSGVAAGGLGIAGAGGSGVTQNYQIDAHYKTVQDEMTLRDRIRLESMLNAPTAG